MLIEYCAAEIFKEHGEARARLFREHKLAWYAERVHAVRERLETELDRGHTVAELARSVGMSMFHFTRVFTELVGQSPHRYLGEARLRAAQSMLQAGRSVTETCFACGSNSLSHFHYRFTGRYGVTPSRINDRKLARNRKRPVHSPVQIRPLSREESIMSMKSILSATAVLAATGAAFAGVEEDRSTSPVRDSPGASSGYTSANRKSAAGCPR